MCIDRLIATLHLLHYAQSPTPIHFSPLTTHRKSVYTTQPTQQYNYPSTKRILRHPILYVYLLTYSDLIIFPSHIRSERKTTTTVRSSHATLKIPCHLYTFPPCLKSVHTSAPRAILVRPILTYLVRSEVALALKLLKQTSPPATYL